MIYSFSYIDKEYANIRVQRDRASYDEWNSLTEDEKQLMLNESARVLDNLFKWAGDKSNKNQELEFPRIFNNTDSLILNDFISQQSVYNNQIPDEIKKGQMQILIFMLRTIDFDNVKKAGDLGITHVDGVGIAKHGFNEMNKAIGLELMKFTKFYEAFNPLCPGY
jgi:hypothetical protein